MSTFRPRIYVAGKYSAPTDEERLTNTNRAIQVGLALWKKGYAPFIPHLSHFADNLAATLGGRLPYSDWIAWDDAYQEVCHAFFYLSASTGADRELKNAHLLSQPVFRVLDDVPLARDFFRIMRHAPADTRLYHESHAPTTEVLIQRLPHAAGLPLPEYKTDGAAAVDLYAATPEGEEQALYPNETAFVPTGYAIAMPEGRAALVLPRSSLAMKHNVSLSNTLGLVDCDYRGELFMALHNFGHYTFNFKRGVRLAQLLLISIDKAVWNVVPELPATERGTGGFGSTGA